MLITLFYGKTVKTVILSVLNMRKLAVIQISVDFHDFLPESPKFLEFKGKTKLFKISNFTDVMLKKCEGKALTFNQFHNI